jgi:nucleoside-diphosphate-sugar epimerase
MVRVGVIGANGFVGNRIVEMLHLDRTYEVRPITRRASGLALASRFGIEGRVADGFDEDAVSAALEGCELVVHALAGDRQTIVGTIIPVYRAAERAGCRRLIYLSSAMVHGQSPPKGCDESTPLSRKQDIEYNVSKVIAEERLFALRRAGRVEVAALRPGIIYGPRSQWVGGVANAILSHEAYLVDGGMGICNAIYVDHVVDAVIRSFDVPEADGQAFLLGEEGIPRWRDIYARVALAIGRDPADIPDMTFSPHRPGLMDRLDELRRSRGVKAVMRSMPRFLSDGLAAFWAASGALPKPGPAGPVPTLEMALLHRARHVPSWQKARDVLGYKPLINNEEAWRRTISWLAFAGYPVAEADHG